MKKKLLFIDVETTGEDANKHCICQLSYELHIDDIIVSKGNFNVKPINGKEVSYAALEYIGKTVEDLKAGEDYTKTFKRFLFQLELYTNAMDNKDKIFFVAYNSRFDRDFILQYFKDHNNPYFFSFFHTSDIDVMRLAGFILLDDINKGKISNFQQATVARYIGMEVDESRLHDADYDLELLKYIYKWCETKLNNGRKTISS